MKKFLSLAMLAFMAITAISLTSCGSDDDSKADKDLSKVTFTYTCNFSQDFLDFYDVKFIFTDGSGKTTETTVTKTSQTVNGPELTDATQKIQTHFTAILKSGLYYDAKKTYNATGNVKAETQTYYKSRGVELATDNDFYNFTLTNASATDYMAAAHTAEKDKTVTYDFASGFLSWDVTTTPVKY